MRFFLAGFTSLHLRVIARIYYCYIQESNFTELEKAFAEARRRSLAQGAGEEKAPAPAAEKPAADDSAETGKAVASKASAVATPKVKTTVGRCACTGHGCVHEARLGSPKG